jgi:hypothetical protein
MAAPKKDGFAVLRELKADPRTERPCPSPLRPSARISGTGAMHLSGNPGGLHVPDPFPVPLPGTERGRPVPGRPSTVTESPLSVPGRGL